MDVAWAGRPAWAAAATIQSVSTPPPCPPRAAIITETGRRAALMPAARSCRLPIHTGCPFIPAAHSYRLEEADRPPAESLERPLTPAGVVHHARFVEGRAEDGRVRDLAAEPAADARLVHVRHRVVAQGVAAVLEREGRAAVQTHAGLVPRADIGVHAEAWRLHAPARLEPGGRLRLDAPLALELALAAGDDDLEPARRRRHGLANRLERVADLVGIDHADPRHAQAADRLGDGHAHGVSARVHARGQP